MPGSKKGIKKASKKSKTRSAHNKPTPPSVPPTLPAEPVSSEFESRLESLIRAINNRKYDQAELIGNELLDLSPSEEVDRCLNDIISSATTIRDAEDEIRYQLNDLDSALEHSESFDPATAEDGL